MTAPPVRRSAGGRRGLEDGLRMEGGWGMVLVKGGRGYHVLDLAGGQNWREERLVRGKGIEVWLDRSIFTVTYSYTLVSLLQILPDTTPPLHPAKWL